MNKYGSGDRGLGWPFDDPIEVSGRKLVTLRDADEHIAGLPKAVHDQPEWRPAMEALLLAAAQPEHKMMQIPT